MYYDYKYIKYILYQVHSYKQISLQLTVTLFEFHVNMQMHILNKIKCLLDNLRNSCAQPVFDT